MFGLGPPKVHYLTRTCAVCGYETITVNLENIHQYVCMRCIERAILWAADKAYEDSYLTEENRQRYSPAPPAPSRSLNG